MDVEQDLLRAIWQVTLLLALAAGVVFLVLVVWRAISSLRAQKRLRRRQELDKILQSVLHSPVPLGATALPALRRGDFPIVLDLALEMIRMVRGSYVDEIVSLVSDLGLYPYLQTVLRRSKGRSRRKALIMLGYFPPSQSRALLLAHVDDADPYVQLTALRGLARHPDASVNAEALRALGATLHTNSLMLADVLHQFGERALPELHALAAPVPRPQWRTNATFHALRRERHRRKTYEHVRVAAITAIGNIGALSSSAALLPLLHDENAHVRAAAVTALGRIGDPAIAWDLSALLRDKEVEVRIQSAQALGLLQDESTLPALVDALGDTAWWARFHAACALAKFEDRGIAILRAISREKDVKGDIAGQVLAEMAVL
ncbi:hypothetical protein CKO11_04810 [Rhodobacter sp. TJ_12]|uniref:HEAT repeat domain-containing protein n=1 Tax=Rhodobacter sp. TJ_12 TaxID=2029399 RepID=UPI001CC08EAD|nr:HEAT repeat domain-containing protein [Rhodobacter sp. TJ_12]MBZ4021780.1 hypothetical protein [Rhodobacter sp. TJ_12]